MRILHVCQNYFPSKGGPQYTMQHVSEKLAAWYGDDVTVCTTNSLYNPESVFFKKVTPAAEVINNVKVKRLPFNRWHYPFIKYGNKILIKTTGLRLPEHIGMKRYNLDSPAIKKAMLFSNADVIMATTINYDFCNYPLWRKKSHNAKPFVLYGAIHLHKEITDENNTSLIKARTCDCYISNTVFEQNEMIKYGVNPTKIVTIGTGINVDDFAASPAVIKAFKNEHGINDDEVIIGYIGRLVKGKGVALLLDAFRILYQENKKVKLLLAGGSTEYVPAIKKIIAEESLPVILIENFTEELKPLLYNTIDVFVLASQSESFGVVFLEAWACRKAVIGTNLGAVASLVKNGHDGLLFNPGDTKDLVQKIKQLINNKNQRETLGNNGYSKTAGNYSWPVIIKKYRDAYLLAIDNFNQSIKK